MKQAERQKEWEEWKRDKMDKKEKGRTNQQGKTEREASLQSEYKIKTVKSWILTRLQLYGVKCF